MQSEADKEREEIVAWLRDKRDWHLEWAEADTQFESSHRSHANACLYAANAIERLAHKGKDHEG